MPEWIDVSPLEALTEATPAVVTLRDRPVLLCRVGESVYAVEDRCPHADMPLRDGSIDGCALTCPYHGYTYNLKNGQNIDEPIYEPPVRTYPVRIEAGRVWVSLDAPESEA